MAIFFSNSMVCRRAPISSCKKAMYVNVGYCKISNKLQLFDSITLHFELSIYMEQKISKPQNYKCKQKLLVLIYSHAMLHVLTLSFDITQTKAIRCRTLSNCPKKQVEGNEFWFDTKITIFYGKQQIKLRRG